MLIRDYFLHTKLVDLYIHHHYLHSQVLGVNQVNTASEFPQTHLQTMPSVLK